MFDPNTYRDKPKSTIPARGSWDVSDKSPRERLEMLRNFLRTPTPNVAWDYTLTCTVAPECGANGCAFGWYAYLKGEHYIEDRIDEFGISEDADFDIFFTAGQAVGKISGDVTPDDVANAIDHYLETSA